MDTCMRNLSFVHHITAVSPLESRAEVKETGRCRAGLQVDPCEEAVICPKPRRMALSCCAPELIKLLCQWQSTSSLAADCEAGYEILEIFLNRGGCIDGEYWTVGCSPPYCSPPTRSSNPIVQDTQFCNTRRSCSPVASWKPKAVAMPSFSACPSVRIEGFECPHEEAQGLA